MAKFHVNPQTGVPAACGAQHGNCPYGGQSDHFDNPGDAVKAFEKSFSETLPVANSKVKGSLLTDYQKAKNVAAEHYAEANKYPGGDARRVAAFDKYKEARKEENQIVRAIEDAGQGHLIPDDGPTLRVENRAQKVLLEEELLGQLSDGQWEKLEQRDWSNGGKGHWEIWTSAKIIVDPQNVGRNFNADKDNYQLNAKDLLDMVGDRMVESVKDDTGKPYDEKNMHRDLRNLRKVFKTKRAQHDAKEESPTPAPKPAPVSAPQTTIVRGSSTFDPKVLQGPGASKQEAVMFGLHSGRANPSSGDGDNYGHTQNGFLILGEADGKRVRIIAGAPDTYDPAKELGRRVTLQKQQLNSDTATGNLRVLGGMDSKGNTVGWIPDKKIHYFVFK